MLGPTASGKSDLAVRLAEALGAEIVSADSMQVYRGMDIGTAKPDAATRARVTHHLIDLVEPEEPFTAADFQRAGTAVLDDLSRRDGAALIVGGSGLHFRALVDPLEFAPTDPEVRERLELTPIGELVGRLVVVDPAAEDLVDLANPRRVVRALEVHELTGLTPSDRAATAAAVDVAAYRARIPFVAIGVDPGEGLRERVVARFDRMLEHGLLEETARLASRLGPTARHGLGYRQLLEVVAGRIAPAAARHEAIRATLAFAKRQRTYFRRDPRIRWLPWQDEPDRRFEEALASLEEVGSWSS